MSYVDFTKIEDIIREVGDLDIIGFGTDYLDAIIHESVKDNMGVDFSQPVERKRSRKSRTRNATISRAVCRLLVQWSALIAVRK